MDSGSPPFFNSPARMNCWKRISMEAVNLLFEIAVHNA